MVLFSIREIVDIVVMTLALGFIFKDIFVKAHRHDEYDPIKYFKKGQTGLKSDNFKFAVMVTAPAIILHELGHKFVALSSGATAEFHAAYTFLALAVMLKLLNSGIIFFVPAYVAWSGHVTNYQASAIAFAGPLVNLLLWVGAWAWLKYFSKNPTTKKYTQLLVMTRHINMILFFFNMIPLNFGIMSFDGYHVFHGLIKGLGIF